MLVNLRSKTNLVEKLIRDKEYRDAYVFEHVRNGLAFQLRGMRDALGWSQSRMGQEVGKPQNVISRLEDPNYGRPNLQTLLEIASGLGVGLLVKFVPFTRLVKEFEDVSPGALAAPSIDKEQSALEEWAATELAAHHGAAPIAAVLERRTASTVTAHTFKLIQGASADLVQPSLPFERPQLMLATVSAAPGTPTQRPILDPALKNAQNARVEIAC